MEKTWDTVKTEAEIAKLMVETVKLNAEAAKMQRERIWHPLMVGAALGNNNHSRGQTLHLIHRMSRPRGVLYLWTIPHQAPTICSA